MIRSAQNRGFTLVEILLVVSIIAVLSAFLIPGFSNYTESQSIKQGIEIVKSDLRTAQNKALTGVNSYSASADYWGIKIYSDAAENYRFFYSTQNSSCDDADITTANLSQKLPGDVAVLGESGTCVFFSRKNGDTNLVGDNGGDSRIHVGKSDTSIDDACQGVEVNSAGMISVFDEC